MMMLPRSAVLRPSVWLALAAVSFRAMTGCSALANSACGIIPANLQVPEGFSNKDTWQHSSVTPLDLTLGQVKTRDEISVSTMLQQHTSGTGAIAFVVRRPGLSQLAAEHPTLFSQFGLFGIIKEVAVDDEGLLEFHNDYYPYPLYMDTSKQFYEALGSRRITTLTTWNPLRIYRGFQAMKARLQSKPDLSGNMKGEGLVQGGIIVFDQNGDPRAVYQESTGSEIPSEDIVTALKALQEEASGSNDAEASEEQ